MAVHYTIFYIIILHSRLPVKDHLHRDESPTELIMRNDVAEPVFETDTSIFSEATFDDHHNETHHHHHDDETLETLYYKDVPHKTKEELLKHKKEKDHEHDLKFGGGDEEHAHPVLPSNIRRKIIRRGRKRNDKKRDEELRQFTRTPRTPIFDKDDEEEEEVITTGRKILSADAANFGSLEEQQHHMMMMLRNAIAMVELEEENLLPRGLDPIPVRAGGHFKSVPRPTPASEATQQKRRKNNGIILMRKLLHF